MKSSWSRLLALPRGCRREFLLWLLRVFLWVCMLWVHLRICFWKHNWRFRFCFFCCLFFVVIVPLVLWYNVVGASIAITIAYSVMIIYYVVMSRRILAIKYSEVWSLAWPLLSATLVMCFVGVILSLFFWGKQCLG